jgi:hypothetical protein
MYGTSSKEATNTAYKATEEWGKDHPVAMVIGGLVLTDITTDITVALN